MKHNWDASGTVALRTPFLPAGWKASWSENGHVTVMDGDKEMYFRFLEWNDEKSDELNTLVATRFIRIWYRDMQDRSGNLFDSND
jgi:hypothetical protein